MFRKMKEQLHNDSDYVPSEFAKNYSSSLHIMTRVFIVFVIIVFIVVGVYIFSSEDRTTEADRDSAFKMNSSSDTFYTLDMPTGMVDFRLASVEEVEYKSDTSKRYLVTYDYDVKEGNVPLNKIVFAASYVGNSENPFGVKLVPCEVKGVIDIIELDDVSKTDGVKQASCVMEVPASTDHIYTDMGGSASVSGRPSWIEYDFPSEALKE